MRNLNIESVFWQHTKAANWTICCAPKADTCAFRRFRTVIPIESEWPFRLISNVFSAEGPRSVAIFRRTLARILYTSVVEADRLGRKHGLKTRDGAVVFELFYNSFSTENGVFGQGRTASIESNVTSQISNSNVYVFRGNGQQYGFSGSPPSSYGAFLQNNSATTILYDQPNNQFIEYFPSGATCYYKNQGETPPTGYTKHDLYKAVTPAGNVFTYLYGTGAELGLVKAIQSPTDQRVSFAYTASTPTSLLSTATDWGGRIWTYQFDANRNLPC